MPPLFFARDAKAERQQSYAAPQISPYERAKQAVADARQPQTTAGAPRDAGCQPPPFVTQAPPPTNSAAPSFITQAPAQTPPPPNGGCYGNETGASYNALGNGGRAYCGWDVFSDPAPCSPRPAPPAGRAASPALQAPGARRKTLVLDLDETLVHTYFEPCAASFRVPMTMDGHNYTAWVMKRPGCEEFLRKAAELFDVIVWTASLECYAGGVIDRLETLSGCGRLRRMYRGACTKHAGTYVKDLSRLGVRMADVAILDNSPHVAALNPRNLIRIQNYYNDASDRSLYDLLPLLDTLSRAPTVYDAIHDAC